MPQRGEHAEAQADFVAVDGEGGVKTSLQSVADHFEVIGEQDAFVNPELDGGLQVLEEIVRYYLDSVDSDSRRKAATSRLYRGGETSMWLVCSVMIVRFNRCSQSPGSSRPVPPALP